MTALVQWDASPESDTAGYIVWHGIAGVGEYYESFTVAAPTTQRSFTNLDDFKTHHFAVQSFDNANVPNISGLSADVTKRVSHRFTMK